MEAAREIFVVTTTHRIYRLRQKSLKERLNELFRKHMYDLALRIVRMEGRFSEADIQRRAGDYCYSKGDYASAAQEYIATIGALDSSYVIRKFLDAQHIEYLCTYLEAFHKHPQASVTKEHTTLLLKCFTKQQADKKLRAFIASHSGSGIRAQRFDVHNAIIVLRSSGYAMEALDLARSNSEHQLYLQILLEDAKGWQEAIMYIRQLHYGDAEKTLHVYGKILLENMPREMTQLLIDICTKGQKDVNGENRKCNPQSFISIYVNDAHYLRHFLWEVLHGRHDMKFPIAWNTLLELCLRQDLAAKWILENGNGEDKTLAEESVVEEWVMQILKNTEAEYNMGHALLLVERYDFRPGQLYLFEKKKMFHVLLQHYMDSHDHRALITACRKYGDRDPNLWVRVLHYFAQSSNVNDSGSDCEAFILQVLRHVQANNILPPLHVVSILSCNSTASSLRHSTVHQ